MLKKWTSNLLAILLIFGLLASSSTFAATVVKAKGKKVLVMSNGDALEAGQIYTVRDSNDKAVGVVKITKVVRDRAIARLGKGTAQPGQTLKLRTKQARTSKKTSSSAQAATSSSQKSNDTFWGGMAGVSMASADVELFQSGVSAGSVSLDGNGFSAKGLYDYPLLSSIYFRGLLGIEQFNVSGASSSACSGACEIEIMYLTFDFWGRFMLSQGTTRPWVGLGGGLLFPLSKSSSALTESSITNTNIFALGGGADFFLSPKTYIPVQVEYNLYPKSDTVEASSIVIRGGFATEF